MQSLQESFGVCLACKSPQSRFSKDHSNLYSLEESGLAASPDNGVISFIGCFQLNSRGELAPRAIHDPDKPGFEASAQSFGSKSSQHYSVLTLRRTQEEADDVHVVCPLLPTCSTFAGPNKMFVGGEDGGLRVLLSLFSVRACMCVVDATAVICSSRCNFDRQVVHDRYKNWASACQLSPGYFSSHSNQLSSKAGVQV